MTLFCRFSSVKRTRHYIQRLKSGMMTQILRGVEGKFEHDFMCYMLNFIEHETLSMSNFYQLALLIMDLSKWSWRLKSNWIDRSFKTISEVTFQWFNGPTPNIASKFNATSIVQSEREIWCHSRTFEALQHLS